MSAHRFFIDPSTISPDRRVKLVGQDTIHISRVLRLRLGDTVILSDGHGKEFKAEIKEIGKNDVSCLIKTETEIPHATIFISVYQALPKAKKMDKIVDKLTEIGIDRIIPVVTERSIPELKREQRQARVDRWRKISIEASKQSQRAFLPEIVDISEWESALKMMQDEDILIVPWEEEEKGRIKEIKMVASKHVGIIIGPEGGFEKKEIDDLKELGAKTVSLGSNILRTETAAVVASALVMERVGTL